MDLNKLSSSGLIDLLTDLKIQKKEIEVDIAALELEFFKYKFIEIKEQILVKKHEKLEIELNIQYIEREVLKNKRKQEQMDKRLRFEYSDRLLSNLMIVCEQNGCFDFIKEARKITKICEK
jgi:hypothetical protein